jgi:hypothetical protein
MTNLIILKYDMEEDKVKIIDNPKSDLKPEPNLTTI